MVGMAFALQVMRKEKDNANTGNLQSDFNGTFWCFQFLGLPFVWGIFGFVLMASVCKGQEITIGGRDEH